MHASSKIVLQQIVSNIHYTIKLNSISDKCFSKLMKSNSLLQQTLSVFLFVSVLKWIFVWLTSSQILYIKKSSSMYLRNVYYVGFKNGISAMFIKYNSFIYSIKYACKSTLPNLVYVMNK